jgi:YjjG family noncanonical pyrimidine nucleotidase
MVQDTNFRKKGAILFDLDHTLWDHDEAQQTAVKRLCVKNNIDFDIFYPLFDRINQEMWKRFARGEGNIEELRIQRFTRSLEAAHIDFLSPDNLSADYLHLYPSAGVFLMEHTIEILEALKSQYILGIITNGTRKVQDGKIERAEICHYFDFMITVDEAGCSKPDTEFFKMAFRRSGAPPEKITCIGDNFYDDIVGAHRAGAGKTIWMNSRNLPFPEEYGVRPDHIITSLKEILPIFMD